MLPLRIVSAARGKGAVPAPVAGTDPRSVDANSRGVRRGLVLITGIFAGFFAFVALPEMAAHAGEADSSMVVVPRAPLDLDGLFAKLKQAPDAESAAVTSRAIQQRWAHSGSDTADLL